MNLEELNYPMFETTKEEKIILRLVYDRIDYCEWYVCNILGQLTEIDKSSLTIKIKESLVGETLLGYMFNKGYNFLEVRAHGEILRKIWIQKLLAYSPENN